MMVYLIKMTTCALLLYAIYAVLLEKEKMHRFKRIYLLVSLIFSMMIPFTSMTINVEQMPANIGTIYTGWNNVIETPDKQTYIIEMNMQVENKPTVPSINYSLLLLSVYVMISSFFLFRMLKNCLQMFLFGQKNACMDYHGAKIALMDEKTVPHSFGRYIFVNREDYYNVRIPDEIILHEWAHVKQRHTYDIMFIELLIAFGWFNPVFYLYRNKIRQNHEFLADDTVTGNNQEHIPAYQTILLNCISQNKDIIFSSSFNFNFLFTKKRIVMMTKTTSKKGAWCRSIALIPVFIAAFCVFSTKTIAQNDLNTLLTYESVENPVPDDRTATPEMDVPKEKIPTVFEPNKDGKNELFLEGYDLQVFNRLGSLLYKGTNGWDGTCKGELMPEGVYYYIAIRSENDGEKQTFTGFVTLNKQNSQNETKITYAKAAENCDFEVEGSTLEQRFPVHLNAANSGEQVVFKKAIALSGGQRYRFTICTDEVSAGEAILLLFEKEELIWSSHNPETDRMQQYFDIDIDKTTIYVLFVTFKDGKEGSAVVSTYHIAKLEQ